MLFSLCCVCLLNGVVLVWVSSSTGERERPLGVSALHDVRDVDGESMRQAGDRYSLYILKNEIKCNIKNTIQ